MPLYCFIWNICLSVFPYSAKCVAIWKICPLIILHYGGESAESLFYITSALLQDTLLGPFFTVLSKKVVSEIRNLFWCLLKSKIFHQEDTDIAIGTSHGATPNIRSHRLFGITFRIVLFFHQCRKPPQPLSARGNFVSGGDRLWRASNTISLACLSRRCTLAGSSVRGWQIRYTVWRVASSGMLRRVALVRSDVSEELSATFIRVTRIGELGTKLAVTNNNIGISSQRASVASYS
jgi:hypothetical protein